MRVIVENLQLASDRVKLMDKRKGPFNRLLQLHYERLTEKLAADLSKLAKVVSLQRAARRWLARTNHLSQLNSEQLLE